MKPTRNRLLLILIDALLLASSAMAQGQFTFTTNNGAITITGYSGSGGSIAIPEAINGYPVTTIGTNAFYENTNSTSITIPDSVTTIGGFSFAFCNATNFFFGNGLTTIGSDAFEACLLTSVAIPDSVTNLGFGAFWGCPFLAAVTIGSHVTDFGSFAFYDCGDLTNVTIDNGVTNIGESAFQGCYQLTRVTIPSSVASIGSSAFGFCGLTNVFFQGNCPTLGSYIFYLDNNVTVYYLPGTTGWGAFIGIPMVPWFLPTPLILNHEPGFGFQTNGFGFTVSWATNVSLVVDASTNLSSPIWQPVQTNGLTEGTFNFTDPQWTNYPSRFYRLRSP